MKTNRMYTHNMVVLAGLSLVAGCGGGTDPLTRDAGNGGGDGSMSRSDASPLDLDALMPAYRVRGTALGVTQPLTLELAHAGGQETAQITADGPFAFSATLIPGSEYTVTLPSAEPCVLDNATGTAGGADASELRLTCDGVAALASAVIASREPAAIPLMPAQLAYAADLPLLLQSTTVTATVAHAQATIELAGMPLASGTPSPAITLALGANPVEIVVRHPVGLARTYSLTLNRARTMIAQYAYTKAASTDASDAFGTSVALWGDTLVVGAYGEDSSATGVGGDPLDDTLSQSGAVYVFRRVGTQWQQEAYLKASNTGAGDQFGRSVALWGDTLAVGAWQEDSAATGVGGDDTIDGAGDSGAVYVFRRGQAGWQQEAYIKASNTNVDDRFGYSVALWDDALAVGAYREDSSSTVINGDESSDAAPDSGAVYVFRRLPAGWEQEAYVKAPNAAFQDQFGWSVALRGDTLAVGATQEDSAATGVGDDSANNDASDSGAVYVFRRGVAGWEQEAYVKASNTEADDQFGFSVALEDDVLAVGAVNEASDAAGVGGNQDSNAFPLSGAVYLLRRGATGWEQQAYIKASNPSTGDIFGRGVALWGDLLAVGAYWEGGSATGINGNQDIKKASQSGAVYLYRRSAGGWEQDAYIKSFNSAYNDHFGIAVALWEGTLAAGASGEDSAGTGINSGLELDNGQADSGASYIFH